VIISPPNLKIDIMKRFVLGILLMLTSYVNLSGQMSESPVDQMNALNQLEENLQKKYLSYMSEVAHGKRARKMEKRRVELLNSINDAIQQGSRLRPYKNDPSLRDAFKQYWTVLLTIFKEDYHKIVDMEEVAERSYDAMEQYLLIQEKASEKLHEAHAKVGPAYETFAARHNVRLTEGQSTKLSERLGQTGQVNSYMNKIYLLFFKSNVQEELMLEAVKKNDINGVEQSKNSLLKFSTEGLERLDTMKLYKEDASLITACRTVLQFQKDEATNKASYMTDFLLKKEEFDKMRKAFETKPANRRTQEDINAFNHAVDDYNKAVNFFNKTSAELDKNREKVINNWEATRKKFMDVHVPYRL
jgi:hypothetical protein